ncbi:MAG: ABC transporter ATP-binding protein [Candidatus Bathyarchaeia archaeon]
MAVRKPNANIVAAPVLSVQGLKTYFYTSDGVVKAVDGVTFSIGKGKSVGLVGESGCGKSCTALSIMRLVPIPGKTIEGSVHLLGRDLLTLTEPEMRQIRGRYVSMIFQDPFTYLNPLMKVGDQIAEAILVHEQLPSSEVTKRVYESLERVGMPSPRNVARLYPYELSGGMRQRVCIAMALATKPTLLIADEPTTALDVTIQAQILDLINRLRQEMGISLLLITHDLGIIAETCDTVVVMYAGKTVEEAGVFQLFEQPQHPYTTGLLGSTLSIEEFKETLDIIGGSVPSLIDPPSGCRFHPRCNQATSHCAEKEPPTVETETGHTVACWLYKEGTL